MRPPISSPERPTADLAGLLKPASPESGADESVASRALRAMRSHLDLQVAYVSEFVGNESVFRTVDAPGLEDLIKPGDRRSLDDVYCRHILEGRLPELIPDTSKQPLARQMPITEAIPIGAHVSVPLVLADGSIYGMFCCLGPQADPSLNDRDLRMMRAFAEMTAFEIDRELESTRREAVRRNRIRDAIDDSQFSMVFQPIFSIGENAAVGFESLARFSAAPNRPPNDWFAEAAEIGLSIELELATISAALHSAAPLPAEMYLAVNASPGTIVEGGLAETIGDFPCERLVIEVTEHTQVDDYDIFEAALRPLREKGARVAADDAGAGYSSLQHILRMKPDLIKLDRSLIQGIGIDPGRRALAAALRVFAADTGSKIVAEGVETEDELAMLRALGIDLVQGYLLGRPASIDLAMENLGGSERLRGVA